MADLLRLVMVTVLGVLASTPLAFLPGLHVYNLIGLIVVYYSIVSLYMSPLEIAIFTLAMTVGYVFMSIVSTVILSAPDDSAVFILFPSQRFALQGRAFEAILLTAVGSLISILFLAVATPLLNIVIPVLVQIERSYLGVIVGLLAVYLFITEWPKDLGVYNKPLLQKLKEAYANIIAGWVTYILSGLLGIIVLWRNPLPLTASYTSLLPVFVGLFAVPSILLNLIAKFEIPRQRFQTSLDITKKELAHGLISGIAGGGFAATIPVVTAGIGAMITGQMTAVRRENAFMVSQGASRAAYYVGALFFLFLPFRYVKGGAARMLSFFYDSYSLYDLYIAAAMMCLAAVLSFMVLIPISKKMVKIAEKYGIRHLSIASLIAIVVIVWFFTGWQGVAVMVVATFVGLIPILFHSRRTMCLAVLLVPMALDMLGFGPQIMEWMGL